jgi:hypothetical protein
MPHPRNERKAEMTLGSGRGRDAGYPAPPAQIRACATNAHGSYLGYLARNRSIGLGCRILGSGRYRSMRVAKRSHVHRLR